VKIRSVSAVSLDPATTLVGVLDGQQDHAYKNVKLEAYPKIIGDLHTDSSTGTSPWAFPAWRCLASGAVVLSYWAERANHEFRISEPTFRLVTDHPAFLACPPDRP
jgi:hypothetical protein